MAGLVPAIHVLASQHSKTWMPGTRPGMTEQADRVNDFSNIQLLVAAEDALLVEGDAAVA